MEPHRLVEELAQAIDQVGLAPSVIRRERDLPVALRPGLAVRGDEQQVAGLELLDAGDDALRRRRGQEREDAGERVPVEPALDLG